MGEKGQGPGVQRKDQALNVSGTETTAALEELLVYRGYLPA